MRLLNISLNFLGFIVRRLRGTDPHPPSILNEQLIALKLTRKRIQYGVDNDLLVTVSAV